MKRNIPMTMTVPARFVGLHLPTTTEDSEQQVRDRLSRSLRKRRLDHYGMSDGVGGFLGSDEELESWLEMGQISPTDRRRIFDRARCFFHAKVRSLDAVAHIKGDDRKTLISAVREGHARGVVNRDLMEERIAELHSTFPWLAPASTAVMKHMRSRTRQGPAPLHLPPLILLGGPGIAKSSWSRAVARIFCLPTIEVDVGATNGATFALSGTERGWGSAAPGRVVQTMLRERIANPVVIINEIDKIPAQIATVRGSALPGGIEVLKSMLEPTSARNWICPYYQIPINLSAVSWIMTTNSVDHMPQAFLDRCMVIEIGDPTLEHLVFAGKSMIAARLPEDLRELGEDAMEDGIHHWAVKKNRISLRMVERMADTVTDFLTRPQLM
jgi:hypothetical protein